MSTTISQVERVAEASVVWHIKNWKLDMYYLKKFAKCTMTITNDSGKFATSDPVVIRFFFKEHPFLIRDTRQTSMRLALCGQLVSGGQLPMLMLVNVETNTLHSQTFFAKKCRVDKSNKSCFQVEENFMIEGYYYNKDTKQIEDSKYPTINELIFKITATILNFNKDTLLVEPMDGAVGGDHSESASLIKDIQQIFTVGDEMKEDYSDLRILTQDRKMLRAHKLILAAKSPVFRTIFDEKYKRLDTSKTIKDCCTFSSKALTVILHWMYTGELHDTIESVMKEVLEACVKFEIAGLLKILDKRLITICTVQNMRHLYHVAVQNELEAAKEAISQFIKRHSSLFEDD